MLEINKINVLKNNQLMLKADCFWTYDTGIVMTECFSESQREALFKQILLKDHQFESYSFNQKTVEDVGLFSECNLSVLSQNIIWLSDLTLKEHLSLFSLQRRIRVYTWKLGLKTQMNMQPSELTAKEQIKAGLVMAMASNKPILVLDMPVSYLEQIMSKDMTELLQEYSRNHLVILPYLKNETCLSADVLYQVHEHELVDVRKNVKSRSEISIYQPVCSDWGVRLKLLLTLKRNNKLQMILKMVLLSLLVMIVCLNFSAFIKLTALVMMLWLNTLFIQESLLTDWQLVAFFKQFNWQDKSVKHLLFQKYAIDTVFLWIVCSLISFLYQRLSIHLGIPLFFSAYRIVLTILLCLILMLFYPAYILKSQLLKYQTDL